MTDRFWCEETKEKAVKEDHKTDLLVFGGFPFHGTPRQFVGLSTATNSFGSRKLDCGFPKDWFDTKSGKAQILGCRALRDLVLNSAPDSFQANSAFRHVHGYRWGCFTFLTW